MTALKNIIDTWGRDPGTGLCTDSAPSASGFSGRNPRCRQRSAGCRHETAIRSAVRQSEDSYYNTIQMGALSCPLCLPFYKTSVSCISVDTKQYRL